MRTSGWMAIVLGVGSALAAGCGDNCQSTCAHVYDPSECGIQKAGITAKSLIDDCVDECERALATPGDMGDYNPNVFIPAVDKPQLQTDQQAAAWMDCVWSVAPDKGPQESCAQLDPKNGGICAPI